ncbi:DNA cytosine methyltransferase [Micromonospora sp. WMMD1219]|uniref:DNA cytosine methyltransferase n=1 Tax=Micromonospora sp. WMMD1219 TaxID=3404115 RepID=UPI003BF5E30B
MSKSAASSQARLAGRRGNWAVAEVFAGVGSVAQGFARAGSFDVAYLNDIDEYARRTYRFNYGNNVRYDLCDVRDISGDLIRDAADGRRIAGLLGCPPCQGWSAAGPRATGDPRNLLLGEFFRLVSDIRPLFFVMENVPSVADRVELAAALEALAPDYRTWHGVLNAASYGLPQSRQRTIVIGYHIDTGVQPSPPPPTHGGDRRLWDYRAERFVKPEAASLDALLGSAPRIGARDHKQYSMRAHYPTDLAGLKNFVTVGEAIGDLEPEFRGRCSPYAKALAKGVAAPTNHHPWRHGSDFVARMALVREGRRPPAEATNNRRYYSQAYARLHRRGLARTITTNFHNPGCGRFLHYRLHRSLTVREAARLQGFGDDVVFIDHPSWQERVVGNAFPPLWAEVIARHVSNQLDAVLAD